MPKKKNHPTQPPQVLDPKLMGDMPKVPKDLFKPTKVVKGIKIEGEYVIWPSGIRTPLSFIKQGIMKKRPIPLGFYDEAERLNLPNLNLLRDKAKSLHLKEIAEK